MSLIKDLNFGKYNLLLIGIIFIFMFYQYWCASSNAKSVQTKEQMSNISDNIKEAVKQIYLADVEAIRNLSEVATKLQKESLTIPGNLKVTGNILSNSITPIGSIIMWNGSNDSLPINWKFCDGTNGTPDLRGRFIIGTNKQLDGNTQSMGPLSSWINRGEIGGSKDAILVSHSHDVSDPGHSHTVSTGQHNAYLSGEITSMANNAANGARNTNKVTTGITINHTGSSGTNANLPPYYVLAFIMRIS